MLELSLNKSYADYEIDGMPCLSVFTGSGNETSIYNASRSMLIEYFDFDQASNSWYGLIRHWIYADVLKKIGGERSLYPVRRKDRIRYENFKQLQSSLELSHTPKTNNQ